MIDSIAGADNCGLQRQHLHPEIESKISLQLHRNSPSLPRLHIPVETRFDLILQYAAVVLLQLGEIVLVDNSPSLPL